MIASSVLNWSHLNPKSSSVSMFWERWFWSSNAKDIGTLYLIFALFAGLVGTAFSVLIRLELSAPGVQYISDNQLYNSIITAHAIVMIFFMVEKFFNIFNLKPQSFLCIRNTHSGNNNIITTGNNNNNSDKNDKDKIIKQAKYKYVKLLVEDPFNNRDIILKVTKNQKGIYIWENTEDKSMFVGRSINLYNRISSYFMPSILNTKARRVLLASYTPHHLKKYGFTKIKLTVYIMEEQSSL